jgi:hypothetical protein
VEGVSECAWLCLRREGRSPSERKHGRIPNATSQAIIQIAEEQRVALMPLTSTIMAYLNALTPPGRDCPAARAGHVAACGLALCPVPFLATGSPLTPHPGNKLNIIRAQQLENQVLTLSPSDFSYLGDYLSKFKTLRILCEECKIKMEEERCIYLILSKLGSAYSVFVSTFYAMREALGKAYEKPTLESFCAALIREEDKLVQLGVINTAGTSNKALVA